MLEKELSQAILEHIEEDLWHHVVRGR
jgi:hypothetical protein